MIHNPPNFFVSEKSYQNINILMQIRSNININTSSCNYNKYQAWSF